MRTEKLSNALGDVGESYINEAITYTKKRKKSAFLKWVSIAACIALIVIGGVLWNANTNDNENSIMSYFVITAHAANGESTELNVSGSCLSSGTLEYNIFGHNMPLFNFDVRPSHLENNEAVYQRFDISISYNGILVDGKDEHIMISYLTSVHNPNLSICSIIGWFTEPTDVVITVTDKESKAVVEEITVNVKYDANRQEYELKIISLDTIKPNTFEP